LIHLFNTSREDLFLFIAQLNSNEQGKEMWKLFLENLVKFLPQEKQLHILFFSTLIARQVPYSDILVTCVTAFSSSLLSMLSKFFPTISEATSLVLTSTNEFSPLRFELLINEYLHSFAIPDLNLLSLVLLEFVIQSPSLTFLGSCKALIVLYQEWFILDILELRFKKLLLEPNCPQKKCKMFSILQIILLFEQQIDWNFVFSQDICTNIEISDLNIETQTIAWLLDSVTSVSKAYILLQRIVFLVTRSNSIQSKQEKLDLDYWTSLLKNHINKDISPSKLGEIDYITTKEPLNIPHNA
jgi:hypothetical protein